MERDSEAKRREDKLVWWESSDEAEEWGEPLVVGGLVDNGRSAWSWRKRFFFAFISSLILVGLLLSGFQGVYWLWAQWQNSRLAAVPPAAATPSSVNEQRAGDVATAVSAALAPAISLTHDRIAFINNSGGIATISPNGEKLRTLTQSGQRFQFPAWSPEGARIAAIGVSREGAGVYIVEDGEGETAVNERYFSRFLSPIYLYWSPDGRYLSFIANHTDGGLALYLTQAEGSPNPRILSTGSPFYWHWFSSSEQMLIHSGGAGENARLALLDVNGGGLDENIAAPGSFQSPAISANGRFWAYAEEQQGGNSWLTVWDQQTGAIERRRHAGLVAMGWSPTADHLAVISGRPDANDFYGPLRLFDLQAETETLLTRDTVLAFFWSPDGRYLAYISLKRQVEDLQVGGKGSAAKTAAISYTPAQEQNAHRFQLHLVEVASGETRLLTEYTPTFLFLSQFLPFFDQYAHSHRLWSPDSRALVLPMRLDGRNQIVVIPADGTPYRPIANGDMPFWSRN